MNSLADYTSTSLLLPDCKSDTAADVIAELTSALDQAGRLSDCRAFLAAVMAREKMSPTSLPIGWATPHARLEALPQLSFALARASQPFRWIAGSELPIRLVWLFAVPEGETKAYLTLIAGVVKLGQDVRGVQQLLMAPDAQAMNNVLEQVSLRRAQAAAPAPNGARDQRPN